jgi:diadenosine tetraphosphate (Ap4A) HIT family hydrolase
MIYENIMVIPIRHVALIEDLIPEELVDIFDLVKRVNKYFQEFHNTTAYNLFINNGTAAGQHEPHAHFHFFGRSKTEEVSPYKKMKSPDLHHVEKLSSDELKRRVTEIRGRI